MTPGYRLLAKLAQRRETSPNFALVLGIGSQRHQSAHSQRVIVAQRIEQARQCVDRQTELAGFRRRLHLDEDIDDPPFDLKPSMQRLRQFQSVQRLHFVDQSRDVFCLIRLQVPNDYPRDAAVGQLWRLFPHFLRFVFAEAVQSQSDGSTNQARIERLAHRQNGYRCRIATGYDASGVDTSAYAFQLNGKKRGISAGRVG